MCGVRFDTQLADEVSRVWWAKTRAAVCGVLRRVARKRARREGGERGGGASGSGGHLAGSKRAEYQGRMRSFDLARGTCRGRDKRADQYRKKE